MVKRFRLCIVEDGGSFKTHCLKLRNVVVGWSTLFSTVISVVRVRIIPFFLAAVIDSVLFVGAPDVNF
jgi:hypothetical protein